MSLKFQEFLFESHEQLEEEKGLSLLMKELSNIHFNDLEIKDCVGGGSFAKAYKCKIKDFQEDFVVKIYKDIETYQCEEKMKRQVKSDSLRISYHPNVVPILRFSRNERIDTTTLPDPKFWSDNGLEGIIPDSGMVLTVLYPLDLDKFLKQRAEENYKLSPLEVILLLRGILKGVDWLHTKGIVHRDLHPENIFVDPEKGRVWIADFGCSLDLRKNFGGFKVDKKHHSLLSLSYYSTTPSLFKGGGGTCSVGGFLAPEISNFDPENEDHLNYDKCDLYAVGVLGKYLLHHSEALPDGEMKKHLYLLLEGLTKENMDERISWKKSLKTIDFAYDCCRVWIEKRNKRDSSLPPKIPNQKRKWNSGKSKIYHVHPSHCLLEKRVGVYIFFSVEREKYFKRLLHSCQLITSCRFGKKNSFIHGGCRADKPDNYFFYKSNIGEEDKKKCEGCDLVLYVTAPEYDHMCIVDVGFSILSRSSENGVEWVGKEQCFQYYEDYANISSSSSVGNKIKDITPNPTTEQEFTDSGTAGDSIFGSDGQSLFGEGGNDNYNENQTDMFNANVLFYAVAQDKVDLVKFLVEKRGFNVNSSDILGYSIRDIAEYFNRNELFSYLLDKGTESQKGDELFNFRGIDQLLNDKEVVLEAVKQNGYSLVSSEEHGDNKEVLFSRSYPKTSNIDLEDNFDRVDVDSLYRKVEKLIPVIKTLKRENERLHKTIGGLRSQVNELQPLAQTRDELIQELQKEIKDLSGKIMKEIEEAKYQKELEKQKFQDDIAEEILKVKEMKREAEKAQNEVLELKKLLKEQKRIENPVPFQRKFAPRKHLNRNSRPLCSNPPQYSNTHQTLTEDFEDPNENVIVGFESFFKDE